VNRRKVWRDGPVCPECATETTATVRPPDGPLDSGRCEACGLRVAVRRDPRRKLIVCSETCRQRAYRRPTAKTVTACDQCGSEFEARRDARYCSPACRQTAYRNRIGKG